MNLSIRIKDYLEESGIAFKTIDHPPGETCADVAKARGTNLELGGKSLLIKADDNYYIFVLSAAKKADSNKIRKVLGQQKVRFATNEELRAVTEAIPGTLPPLGRPFYPLELFLDDSILDNTHIVFNGGILTSSFMLTTENYLKIVTPKRARVSI